VWEGSLSSSQNLFNFDFETVYLMESGDRCIQYLNYQKRSTDVLSIHTFEMHIKFTVYAVVSSVKQPMQSPNDVNWNRLYNH